MTIRIAFLRAVNVGRRKVSMARVVATMEELGYDGVWTHANSGNVVFEAPASYDGGAVHREGAREGVRVRGHDLRPDGDGAAQGGGARTVPRRQRRHLLHHVPQGRPSRTVAKALEDASNDFDTLVVRGRDVHWRMRGRSVETRVTSKTWNLVGDHGSTSRNVNLLRRLDAKLRT